MLGSRIKLLCSSRNKANLRAHRQLTYCRIRERVRSSRGEKIVPCRNTQIEATIPGLLTRALSDFRFRTLTSFDRRSFYASSNISKSAAPLHADEDPYEDELAAEIAQFATSSIGSVSHTDNTLNDEYCSLDLELGENSIWDNPLDLLDEEENDWLDSEMADSMLPRQKAEHFRPTKKSSPLDMLKNFDPKVFPEDGSLDDAQLWLECEAQREAVLKYRDAIVSARNRGDYATLPPLQDLVMKWFEPIKEEIETRQKEYLVSTKTRKASRRYGPLLCAIDAEKIAVIVSHEALIFALKNIGGNGKAGCPVSSMAQTIGAAIEDEVVIQRVLRQRLDAKGRIKLNEEQLQAKADQPNDDQDKEESKKEQKYSNIQKWTYSESHLNEFLSEVTNGSPSKRSRRSVENAIRRARQIIQKDENWCLEDHMQLGMVLLQILCEKATVVNNGTEDMAFRHERRWIQKNKSQNFVVLNDAICSMAEKDTYDTIAASTMRHKPMVVQPEIWTRPNKGGYKWINVDLVRYHGCSVQKEALKNADLSMVYDGLNSLGQQPWKINKKILGVAWECWNRNISLGDIPSQTDHVLPPEPTPPDHALFENCISELKSEMRAAYHKYREDLYRYRRTKQRNMDLLSLRCSAMLTLNQADKFKDFKEIFFPYNMDFRGRAYPVPPHLSNVGSDLCRGLLRFAKEKPLGPRGLYWLKVHLANLAGKDKMSFDDRAKYADDNMENVRASVNDPFGGDRWWMELDDPFQGLATCHEIIDAIDSGNPDSYMSSLTVHMDGSCNGLQHYAALGRDVVGGKAVNLMSCDEPQDVYIGVMHEVIRRVAEDAEQELDFNTSNPEALSQKQKKQLNDHNAAKLVNGLIDRGVVKRTVMTSVYGVTYIGARTQIMEKVEEKLKDQGHDIDDLRFEIFHACGYLASVTMDAIGELFVGARETMNWLTQCARLVAHKGYPVAWMSPIGLPAIQPYRQQRSSRIVTVMHTLKVTSTNDYLPIHKTRQVSAFPPNYVHSLDSSHMLMTALEMDRRGLSFSAVHDSFWTHACDIDEMNVALRDCFVELYEQPLLERLKESFEMRYPDIEFPKLPEKGNLDLNEVKLSKYFFQ